MQARLLLLHFDMREGWKEAEALGPEVADVYWAAFRPIAYRPQPGLTLDVVHQLLAHGHAAKVVRLLGLSIGDLGESLRPELVIEALRRLAGTSSKDETSGVEICFAVGVLLAFLRRCGVPDVEVAELEWAFLPTLEKLLLVPMKMVGQPCVDPEVLHDLEVEDVQRVRVVVVDQHPGGGVGRLACGDLLHDSGAAAAGSGCVLGRGISDVLTHRAVDVSSALAAGERDRLPCVGRTGRGRGLAGEQAARPKVRFLGSRSVPIYQVEYSRNLIFESGRVMERAFDTIVDRTPAGWTCRSCALCSESGNAPAGTVRISRLGKQS